MNETVDDVIVLPGFYPTSAPNDVIVLPGFYPTSAHSEGLKLMRWALDAMSNSKFFTIVLIIISFVFVLSAWAIMWSYKKRKDDSLPFTSLWIAKEYHFISLQILINFAILGALTLIGVLMERAGKPVFNLTMVIDVLIYLLLFTMAIWCCFLVKEKVEVYLNYVYKATDAYSRLHLLLLYTILASLFSLLAR